MSWVFYTSAVHEFDQYFATRRYLDLALSPDGSQVVFSTDIDGRFNAWRLSSGGGWPYQLTAFRDRAVQRVAWSPDGKTLALAADHNGDENFQLYVMPAAGGTPRRLTSRSDVRYLLGSRPWSPDGRTLACTCNADDPANFDLVLIDTVTGAVRRISCEPLYYLASCWSQDGRYLAGVIERSNVHSDIVFFDRELGELRCLTGDDPPARRWPIGFSADASSLYLLTDQEREFLGLARLGLRTGALDRLKTPERDLDLACMSADARWILYVSNEDGVHRLHLLDRNSGIERPHPPLPMGRVLAACIADDGSRGALLHSAARRPAEVVMFDFSRGALETITHGMIGAIPPEEMVEPEIIRYASFDRRIPALLYRPPGEPPPGGWPAVVFVHGGPEFQEQPAYRPLYQYVVSRGLLILAPNIRGSTGYGKSYQRLIHRDWGGGDLRDLDAAARYLAKRGDVDGTRLAVAGESYGGFLALSCATRQPDRWAAAVDVSGPSDLLTFARNVPESWRRFLPEWLGDPDEDADELERRSPIRHVDGLRCPLLILQGANDPRVPREESDRMVARIRERGGTVDYVLLRDEGHMFLKRASQLRAGRAIARFLLRRLGREGA